MNTDSPVLETERLILRIPEPGDFDAFARFMATESSARFVGGVQTRALAWRGFMQIIGSWWYQGFTMFSVLTKDGEWIGRVGPWMPEGWPGTEVGWGIVTEHWGKGYATEAATASIDWAFDTLGWDEVIHAIAPDNVASIRVAEKLGASNRGPGKLPPPFDAAAIDIWGQTRSEWEARRRQSAIRMD